MKQKRVIAAELHGSTRYGAGLGLLHLSSQGLVPAGMGNTYHQNWIRSGSYSFLTSLCTGPKTGNVLWGTKDSTEPSFFDLEVLPTWLVILSAVSTQKVVCNLPSVAQRMPHRFTQKQVCRSPELPSFRSPPQPSTSSLHLRREDAAILMSSPIVHIVL